MASSSKPPQPNLRGLHKQLQSLKRASVLNTRLRELHAESPLKFEASELQLHDATLSLSSIATTPSLYSAFVRAGGVTMLVDVLGHANVDIVTAVLRVLDDLTNAEGESRNTEYQTLYDALISCDAFDAILTVLNTFVIADELDVDPAIADTFAHGLAVFENALDILPEALQLGTRTEVLAHCALKLKVLNVPHDVAVSEARLSVAQGAVELLALLLQDSPENRVKAVQVEAVRALVDAAAVYVSRVVRNAEEAEMSQNILGVLCSALLSGDDAKRQFVEADGVELMVHFARKSRDLRASAVKVLDFACMGCIFAVSRAFEAGIIGVLFAVFMKIGGDEMMDRKGKKRKRSVDEMKSVTEHVLGTMFSLFRYAEKDSLDRLLYKFWEGKGEKMHKLLRVYKTYAEAVDSIPGSDGQYLLINGVKRTKDTRETAKSPQESEVFYLERLDAGLFIVQLSAVLLTQILADGPVQQKQALRYSLPSFGLSERLVCDAVRQYSSSIEAADGNAEALLSRSVEQARLKRLVHAAVDPQAEKESSKT